MKITFSNLGTIKKTELDLRPLTVIIGPNNASKTYVAYSIYGLWQSGRDSNDLERVLSSGWDGAKWKKSGSEFSIKIDEDMLAQVNRKLKGHADRLTKELDVFFQDSSHKIFVSTKFNMDISRDELLAAIKQVVTKRAPYSSVARNKVTLRANPQAPANFMETAGDATFTSIFMSWIQEAIFGPPLLMPAERTAFIITYKILAARRYKILKDAQRELLHRRAVDARQLELLREQGDIRYPKPIEDFLDFLAEVELPGKIKAGAAEKNHYQKLADEIESKVQGKNKIKFKATALGGREIRIDVNRQLSIDLYNASSSIKQLTPFLLYLRYRAKPNDFLIIDEPEMNLHPESQAKLLEVLGILVNLGVRVLLTTHSPYFMSHLNNLVAGDTTHPEILEQQASSLYLKDHRAFLSMDQVSAYEMRNNELCSLKDEDYGIRWDTLSDVSSEIQGRFFEIQEKGRAGRA